MRPLLVGLVVIGFSGCGRAIAPGFEDNTRDVTLAAPNPSTRERLELDTTAFQIHPPGALGSFVARRVLDEVASPVPLSVTDGVFEAYAESPAGGQKIVVTRFEALLADVRFSEEQLPPHGLTLTAVRFELVEPAALPVRWIAGSNLGWAKGTLTVDIHTTFQLSNSPLEVARLQVPVELTVSQTANGLLGVWLQVAREGSLWNWAGLFELSDLTMSLEAFEVRGPDQLPPDVFLN